MAKVTALAGWPPEVLAYAFATYSRSALSIRQSIERITAESSGKFLEKFYFTYGHRSIADNAHIPMALEGISQIAAFAVEDEQLWDGQECSTRYQDFAKPNSYFIPSSVKNTPLEAPYRSVANFLLGQYTFYSKRCFEHLVKAVERPADMKEDVFGRTLKARAFDVARYWLFGGVLTNVGQITSARTLESQISRLMSSEYTELEELGYAMKNACTERPFCPAIKSEPPIAPTLVKYTAPNKYLMSLRKNMREEANQWVRQWTQLLQLRPSTKRYVQLASPMLLVDEIVATLLYEACNYSYQHILHFIANFSKEEKQEIIDLALAERGQFDPLPKAFASGYQIQFDVAMDRGGERDLHRHRNCVQIHQPLTLDRGYDMPQMVSEIGIENSYNTNMVAVAVKIRLLKEEIGIEADYLIPFAYHSATLYKMHLAEAAYITELRSGPAGHFSYREIACEMHRQLVEKFPMIAGHFRVTPFETTNLLKR